MKQRDDHDWEQSPPLLTSFRTHTEQHFDLNQMNQTHIKDSVMLLHIIILILKWAEQQEFNNERNTSEPIDFRITANCRY